MPALQMGVLTFSVWHSGLFAHMRHLFMPESQIGLAAAHSLLLRQATQPVPALQSGLPVICVQSAEFVAVVVHCTQALEPLHLEAAALVQSALLAHCTQAPVPAQTGVAEFLALHCALVAQGWQAYVVTVSQIGVVGVLHSLLAIQETQPTPISQSGFPEICVQSAELIAVAAQGTQTPALHFESAAVLQSVLLRQATQPVLVLQSGSPAIWVQSLLTVHRPQVLLVVLHLEAPAVVQSVLARQATQVLLVVLQTGLPGTALQSVLARQATHWLVVVLQRGLPLTPLQSVSVMHCTQVLVVALHTGVAPLHARLAPHMHLPPLHWVAVVAVHWVVQLPQ